MNTRKVTEKMSDEDYWAMRWEESLNEESDDNKPLFSSLLAKPRKAVQPVAQPVQPVQPNPENPYGLSERDL